MSLTNRCEDGRRPSVAPISWALPWVMMALLAIGVHQPADAQTSGADDTVSNLVNRLLADACPGPLGPAGFSGVPGDLQSETKCDLTMVLTEKCSDYSNLVWAYLGEFAKGQDTLADAVQRVQHTAGLDVFDTNVALQYIQTLGPVAPGSVNQASDRIGVECLKAINISSGPATQ